MKKLLEPFFWILAVTLLIMISSKNFFKLPPIGKVLDPFIGLVQNENESTLITNQEIEFKETFNNTVRVYFDERRVPHVYAETIEDLFKAQGYLVAYFRLWQMEFLTLNASGRISEKISDKYIDHDRLQNRLGIEMAAKKSLRVMENNPQTKKIMDAFTAGVNTYIENLYERDLPVEYKLLDYWPEKWNNLKTALVMKYMMSVLSGFEADQSNTQSMLALGKDEYNLLYPSKGTHIAPMITFTDRRINHQFDSIPKPDYLTYAFINRNSKIKNSGFNPNLGSNSWAVNKSKSHNGNSLLANDPHLNLNIPSIWLEMQLHGPDLNVYGVSIPGVPGILIGFNAELAWGVTNGSVDTKDWYKLQIDEDYKQYFYEREWHSLEVNIDTVRVKNNEIIIDTIYNSVHGPIVYDKSFSSDSNLIFNHALSWKLHKPTDELSPFLKLNMANSANYMEAIKSYKGSALNFIIATKNQDIAGFHQGEIPIKWPGQGMFIMDGSKESHLYNRYIPNDSLPKTFNPGSDYIFSANQRPTDYNYPYFYDGYFVEKRALRIKELLDSIPQFDPKLMMNSQLDNKSYLASYALPILIFHLDSTKLNEVEKTYLKKLKLWKGTYNYKSQNAGLFYLWLGRITDYTWDELNNYTNGLKIPDDFVLVDMLEKDPFNKYFDVLSTENVEDASNIIFTSFTQTIKEFEEVKKNGSIQWGDHNSIHLTHFLGIEQFEIRDLKTSGYSNTINAVSSSWGPSWKMVVEMDTVPFAYGIYPGGQSGNPLSKYYGNSVKDWRDGKYYKLNYFINESEAVKYSTNNWTIEKE